ncbi:MAG: hypothetical protein J0H74_30915 [Chitinophagaceae bacterium]|nr:hypothetical protein [Chitinophagaceae bacterium]
MTAWLRRPVVFWIGLAAIILVYCLYYLYFIYHLSRQVSLHAMHFLKFIFVLAAYGVGVLGLRRNVSPGLIQLWHLVYAASLLLLVLLGIYDWCFTRAPLALRGIADNIQELLVSPVLYVVIGIISYRKGL